MAVGQPKPVLQIRIDFPLYFHRPCPAEEQGQNIQAVFFAVRLLYCCVVVLSRLVTHVPRYLANKCSLASRIDCFSDEATTVFGEKLKDQAGLLPCGGMTWNP